jgi:hypothetical protein
MCAAFPPFEAISRCLSALMLANPRESLRVSAAILSSE